MSTAVYLLFTLSSEDRRKSPNSNDTKYYHCFFIFPKMKPVLVKMFISNSGMIFINGLFGVGTSCRGQISYIYWIGFMLTGPGI